MDFSCSSPRLLSRDLNLNLESTFEFYTNKSLDFFWPRSRFSSLMPVCHVYESQVKCGTWLHLIFQLIDSARSTAAVDGWRGGSFCSALLGVIGVLHSWCHLIANLLYSASVLAQLGTLYIPEARQLSACGGAALDSW